MDRDGILPQQYRTENETHENTITLRRHHLDIDPELRLISDLNTT